MKRAFHFLLPLLILAVAGAVVAYLVLTRPQSAPTTIGERVWRVDVEPLAPRTLAPEIKLYGQVESPDPLRAAASAGARVARVQVREGDQVQRGQLLVELDPRDFTPQIAQYGARVAELHAQIDSETNRYETDRAALDQERQLLTLAEDSVRRARSLNQRKLGSQTDLDTAREELARQTLSVSSRSISIEDHPARQRALIAQLDYAQAQLQQARLAFERSRVVAPYAGIIRKVEVSAGDQVKTDDVLISLYALDTLEVRARIPAPFQAELMHSLAQQGSLPARAEYGAQPVGLSLRRIAGEAGPSGVDGLFRVTRGAERLRLGQMLTLQLQRTARPDVVAVPYAAVYGGNRLYLLQNGRLHGVDVENLGNWFDDQGRERLLVYAAELQAGDALVVTHLPNAIEGLRAEARP